MVKRFVAPILTLFAAVASAEEIPNPLIDYSAFEKGVELVGPLAKSFASPNRNSSACHAILRP